MEEKYSTKLRKKIAELKKQYPKMTGWEVADEASRILREEQIKEREEIWEK